MAWQVIGLQNLKSRKLKTPHEIHTRNAESKQFEDCVRLKQDDIVKFGRVRFRVQKICFNGELNRSSRHEPPLQPHFSSQRQDSLRASVATNFQQTNVNLDRYENDNIDDGFGEQSPNKSEEINIPKQPSISAISQTPMCRICLSEEDLEIGHELISACKCAGGIKWIGTSCL